MVIIEMLYTFTHKTQHGEEALRALENLNIDFSVAPVFSGKDAGKLSVQFCFKLFFLIIWLLVFLSEYELQMTFAEFLDLRNFFGEYRVITADRNDSQIL